MNNYYGAMLSEVKRKLIGKPAYLCVALKHLEAILNSFPPTIKWASQHLPLFPLLDSYNCQMKYL